MANKIEIHGIAQGRFESVRTLMEESVESGADLGLSFAATLEGETVVDLWGGWTDEEMTTPWQMDTIVNVYSTTKTMTALTALFIADRGDLDFASPVARYWPEFAQAGKEQVTVAHLMSHSAGLSGWDVSLAPDDLYDWEKATSLLAAQAPWWTPGSAPGYHAITQGYLVGEVIRRITGKSLGTVFREEIAEPLGADFHIGFGPELDHRVSNLVPPPAAIGDAQMTSDIVRKTFTNPPVDPLATRTRAWRAAEIPAAGGHGNARSVAEIHMLLANGGVAKGKRLLSEAGCRKALELQIEGNDMILMNLPLRYGLGFGLPGDMIPLPNPNSLYWGGYGGSLVVIDMDARATYAYVMNKMNSGLVGDTRSFSLLAAMWSAMAG